MKKVKFTQISRTICPKTQLHYLDAISDDGEYYTAVMSPTKRIGWSILPSGKRQDRCLINSILITELKGLKECLKKKN